MNPNWTDHQTLKRGESVFADSAMAIIIFQTKISALMKFIRKNDILGNLSAFVWRIEYQKRGFPHAHILFCSDFDTQDVHAVERVINVRYPENFPFPHDNVLVTKFLKLVDCY
jgi:hypothetical protein